MFGYVRAVTSVLSPEDAQRYEAVYCGLCRTLGNRYGKTAQLILNYEVHKIHFNIVERKMLPIC